MNSDLPDVALRPAFLGYDVLRGGSVVGAIEGVPGWLEYLEIHEPGNGYGRAAVREFIELSQIEGETEVTATNSTHPAMTHILETVGFEQAGDGWRYGLDDA